MTLDELEALPPAGLQDARPSRIRPHAGRRDHHRPAGSGHRDRGRHGHGRAPAGRASSATTSSTTTPMCWPRTATSWRASRTRRSRSPGTCSLGKLIVLWDDNGISIDGPLSLSDSVDQLKRFEAAGWAAERVDGHDPDAHRGGPRAGAARPTSRRMIACKTIIGYGAPKRAGTSKAHGEPLGAEELAGAKARAEPLAGALLGAAGRARAWRDRRGRAASPPMRPGSKRLAALDPAKRAEFERRMRGDLPAGFDAGDRSAQGEARRRSARRWRPASRPSWRWRRS